jgi:two-component system, LytTR family, sensor kinase
MKFFWKYIFPPLFGLLVYITIRVINDTVSGFKFWERDWTINAIEICSSILIGYIINYALQLLFRKFDREMQKTISYKTVLHELLWVFIVIEFCVNAVFTPMAALTDDGLSWGDFAVINIIPLLFCLIYYAITRSNKILQAYVNNKILLEKMTNDHLQTELKFLKAQYHPHFLFNALNTIYFQMDENVDEAKKTVEKFSELLRYQLYDQQQTVPVSMEIQYLQNFIELQKVRTSEKLRLNLTFDANLNGEQVYPLLFLPLVENAFKYVGGEYKMNISFTKQNETLMFMVENSIPAEIDFKKTGGIGLENLKRRLELLYPGKHLLTTRKRNNSFVAELKLNIYS